MKFLFLSLFLFTLTVDASVKRLAQDLKLPTQAMLHKQTITNPAAADTNGVISATAGSISSSAVTLTAGLSNPGVPRNLVITPGTSTTDVASCVVSVAGTDFYGAALSESFTFSANQGSATTGSKAFKTVSSVTFPANCEDSPFAATWSIGQGEKLGLDRCMADAGDLAWSTVSGTYESTRATMAVNSSSVSGNTADFNGTMDGAADFNIYYVENFVCKP